MFLLPSGDTYYIVWNLLLERARSCETLRTERTCLGGRLLGILARIVIVAMICWVIAAVQTRAPRRGSNQANKVPQLAYFAPTRTKHH